jgi:hypothetical protein
MSQDPLFIFILASVGAVAIILMIGIGHFAKGDHESAKASNKFMRYRIYAQAVAVAAIMLFIYLKGTG